MRYVPLIRVSENRPAKVKTNITPARKRTYHSWYDMRRRCNPETASARHQIYYVSKGVTVCERWNSFENFLIDMGDCPKGLTLDRIDNMGNYEPSNCRWADRSTQRRNR